MRASFTSQVPRSQDRSRCFEDGDGALELRAEGQTELDAGLRGEAFVSARMRILLGRTRSERALALGEAGIRRGRRSSEREELTCATITASPHSTPRRRWTQLQTRWHRSRAGNQSLARSPTDGVGRRSSVCRPRRSSALHHLLEHRHLLRPVSPRAASRSATVPVVRSSVRQRSSRPWRARSGGVARARS